MKTQKGITLIALIITIIVMLILVGVSVSVALNTGLFKTAQGAAKNTEAERVKETALSNGSVTVKVDGEDKTFESMDKYVESLKGGNSDENPLAALKRGDYVSYEQAFGDGTKKITSWRVVSNENGNVKLYGAFDDDTYIYMADLPLTKYGTDSLIGDVTIPSFEQLLTALVGSSNTLTTNEPEIITEHASVSINGEAYKYPALSLEEKNALSSIGVSSWSNSYNIYEEDGCWFCFSAMIDENETIDHIMAFTSIEYEIGGVAVLTNVVPGCIITGGAGTSGSPYTLGK